MPRRAPHLGRTAAQSGKNLERGETEAKFYLANANDAPPANISNAHWRLGQIYEKTARRDLAKAEYSEAVRVSPRNENAKKSQEALKEERYQLPRSPATWITRDKRSAA